MRILRVIVGDRCSLCDVALDRLRLPAHLMGIEIAIESLDAPGHRELFATRVPVIVDAHDRVLAEGRISSAAAWVAVGRARLRRTLSRDSGT